MLRTPIFLPPPETFPRTADLNIHWHYAFPVMHLKLPVSLNKFSIPKLTANLPSCLLYLCKWHHQPLSYASQKLRSYIWSLPLQHSPLIIYQQIFSILHWNYILNCSTSLHLHYHLPSHHSSGLLPKPPYWSPQLDFSRLLPLLLTAAITSIFKHKGDRSFSYFKELNGSLVWSNEFLKFFPWSIKPCIYPCPTSFWATLFF